MPLHRLLYRSFSRLPPEQAGRLAAGIAATSRAHNRADGLTGALLFSRGCFVQVLEGRLARIERAFERIQQDERHHDIQVIDCGPIVRRAFGEWWMGFADAEDVAEQAPEAAAVLAVMRKLATGEPGGSSEHSSYGRGKAICG